MNSTTSNLQIIYFAVEFPQPPFDLHLTIITSSCVLFGDSLLIASFFFIKQIRASILNHMITGIAVSSWLSAINQLILSIYYTQTLISPVPTGAFCQGMGFINILAQGGLIIYNYAFLFIIRQSFVRILKFSLKIKIMTHMVVTFTDFSLPIISILTGNITIDQTGFCTLEPNSWLDDAFELFYILYAISGIATIYLLKLQLNKLKEDDVLFPQQKAFLIKYYNYAYFRRMSIYISLVTLYCLLFASFKILLQFFAEKKISRMADLAHFVEILEIIFLLYFRYEELKFKIKTYFFTRNQTAKQDNEIQLIPDNNNQTFLNTILADLRVKQLQMILTMLVEFYSFNFEVIKEPKAISSKSPSLDSPNLSFVNSNNSGAERKIHFYSKAEDNNNILVEAYFPNYFINVIQKETDLLELESSFDLIKNYNSMKNLTTSDGGCSGEFFFFTSDNKWILKTISKVELEMFSSSCENYFAYLEENQSSIINRIYGLFKLRFSSIRFTYKISSVKLVVMKNISIIPKKYIISIYDLKGSTYARQVLKLKDKLKNKQAFRTLKDLDFHQLEEKIFISPEDTQLGTRIILIFQVKENLRKDTQFFLDQSLIDYSLLVMKVYWKQYLIDEKIEDVNQLMKHLASPLMICKSTKEDGIYYHFSVIDYFQKWNVQKMAEQKTKKIMKMNYKLDISAQNPQIYAERFIVNVINKIFII